MAKVVVKKMSRRNVREAFRDKLHEFEYKYNLKVAETIKELAEEKLGQTLKYRDESGTRFLETAYIDVVHDVNKMKNSVNKHNVKYHIYVGTRGRAKTPHKGWHILNYGRKKGVGVYTKSVSFPLRKSLRTKPYSLNVKPFEGYSDTWVTISKGKPTTAMKGRSFYNRFANSALSGYFKRVKVKRSLELVSKIKVNKP